MSQLLCPILGLWKQHEMEASIGAVPVVNIIMQLLWKRNTWRLGKMKTEQIAMCSIVSRLLWSFLELCVHQHDKWTEQCWRLLRLLHTRLSAAGDRGTLPAQHWAIPANWVGVLCLYLLTQPWQPGFDPMLPTMHVAASCFASETALWTKGHLAALMCCAEGSRIPIPNEEIIIVLKASNHNFGYLISRSASEPKRYGGLATK